MPRVRTIKPELPEDETLGRVSREARLLFILLFTRADDWGRFRASPAYLRGTVFPYDHDLTPEMVSGWLQELVDVGIVRDYSVREERYGVLTNWAKHQRMDNAGRSLCPPPPFAEELGDLQPPTEFNGETQPERKRVTRRAKSPIPNLAAENGKFPLLPLPSPLSPIPHPSSPAASREPETSPEVRDGGAAESGEDEDGGRDSGELQSERLTQALGVLARRDLDAAVARGTHIANRPGWLRAAMANRNDTDGERLAELHAENPGWTATRLADAVDHPEPVAGPGRVAEYRPEGVGNGVPMPDHVKAEMRRIFKRQRLDDAIDEAAES